MIIWNHQNSLGTGNYLGFYITNPILVAGVAADGSGQDDGFSDAGRLPFKGYYKRSFRGY